MIRSAWVLLFVFWVSATLTYSAASAEPGRSDHWVPGTEVDEGPPVGPPPTPPLPPAERRSEAPEGTKGQPNSAVGADESRARAKALGRDRPCQILFLGRQADRGLAPLTDIFDELGWPWREVRTALPLQDLLLAGMDGGLLILPAELEPLLETLAVSLIEDAKFRVLSPWPPPRGLAEKLGLPVGAFARRVGVWDFRATDENLLSGFLHWYQARIQGWTLDDSRPMDLCFRTELKLQQLGMVGMPRQELGENGNDLRPLDPFPQARYFFELPGEQEPGPGGETEAVLLAFRPFAWPETWKQARWLPGWLAAGTTLEIRLLAEYLRLHWSKLPAELQQEQRMTTGWRTAGLPALQADEEFLLRAGRCLQIPLAAVRPDDPDGRRQALKKLWESLRRIPAGDFWQIGPLQRGRMLVHPLREDRAGVCTWFEVEPGPTLAGPRLRFYSLTVR